MIAVIPAYNEEQALPGVLADLARVLPDMDAVVVDDGSSDSTAGVARAAGVAAIRLPFNMGIGGALRAGFRYAQEHGYHTAVQFDADGQHRADQVGLLLSAVGDGAHLVIGNRFNGGDYRLGPFRRLALAPLRLAVRMLCRSKFRDVSSGFRAVARPLLDVFASEYPVEYLDSAETLVAACQAGYRVVEVPVKMDARRGGTPSTGPFRLLYHYLRLAVALAGLPRRTLRPPDSATAGPPPEA